METRKRKKEKEICSVVGAESADLGDLMNNDEDALSKQEVEKQQNIDLFS